MDRAGATIFISYRRSDAGGWAGRLSDSLKIHLRGVEIFRDIEDIPPGVEFDTYIAEAVGSCNVLIALIGPQWLTVVDEEGKRRLEDPADFTRTEISAALKRNVRVIPALVGGARIPSADRLPEDLKSLVRRQAYELTDTRWADDCRKLADVLRPLLQPAKSRRWQAVAGIVLLVLLSAGAVVWYLKAPKTTIVNPPPNQPAATQAANPQTATSRSPGPHQETTKTAVLPSKTKSQPTAPVNSPAETKNTATEKKPEQTQKALGEQKYEQGKAAYDDQRYEEAAQLFKDSAANGNRNAMYRLGTMYGTGQGVPQNYDQSRQWFQKAADAGNADAMYGLGLTYMQGRGVPRDYQLAQQWLEKAANAGNAGAMYALGELYEQGRGVPKDQQKAREWYQKSADSGDKQAQRRLQVLQR